MAELPKTCQDCTDWLNGKNFPPEESAKIQETIAETARIHGLTLNEFLIIADKNGLWGLHNKSDGGTVAVNALKPRSSDFSSGQDRVFTFGHESPGHSSGGNSEDYADLMGSYALGAMNLSNWLNGRGPLTDSSQSATDWFAAYGDSDFIRYNNAWGNFLAEQKDTHKREDGYDRHALGQMTYEELVATDIAYDERYKNDWGHVTGPMLAIGHAGKGLFEFGGLWVKWGANLLTGTYPEAPEQLTRTILSIPENFSNGFVQALQDFSSGDRHRIWYGASNLLMLGSPYIAGKVGETGIVVGGGAGGRAAYLDDVAGAATKVDSASGAARAAQYAKNWQAGDLGATIEKFVGENPIVTMTESGKRIYSKSGNPIQVVEDISGKYFRIEDTSFTSQKRYLDLSGSRPTNITLVGGKIRGATKEEFHSLTHFTIK